MSSKPETNVVNGMVTWLEDRGANVLKIHGSAMQRRSEPDIIGGISLVAMPNNGGRYYTVDVPFAFEVKHGNNTASKLQEYRLEQWARVGFCVGVVYSIDQVSEKILRFAHRKAPACDLMFRLNGGDI